jgi:hypothetical protein
VKGFEINVKLLVDLVMVEELMGLEEQEEERERYK